MSVITSNINDRKMLYSRRITRSGNAMTFGSAPAVTGKVLQTETLDLAHRLAEKVPESFLKNNLFHSACKMAANNYVLFDATVLLALSTTLRPATIMTVPGPSKEDKKYAAAKSIATGLLGFALAAAIYIPLEKHMQTLSGKPVKKLVKDTTKAVKDYCDPKFPKFGTEEYKSFIYMVSNGLKFIIAPLEALALFTMIPIVVNKIFPHKKKSSHDYDFLPAANLNLNKEQKDLFKNFIPATDKSLVKAELKAPEEVKQPKKGLSSGVKHALGLGAAVVAAILGRGAFITYKSGGNFLKNCTKETFLSSIYNSSFVQKFTTSPEAQKNISSLRKHLPAVFGLWISGFYIQNTIRSKAIPEERKTPLVINTLFTGAVGAAGGYAINGAVTKFADALTPRFEKFIASHPEKEVFKTGFKAIVKAISFTFAFRYLAPVLATPVADVVNKYLIRNKMIKDPNQKTNQETKS